MNLHLGRLARRPPEDAEAGELSIVPYLDILMNLILFLLLSMSGLAALGVVTVSAPSRSPPVEAARTSLVLTVAISEAGFSVSGEGGGPALTIAKTLEGRWNHRALTDTLRGLKGSFSGPTRLVLEAEADTPYEVLVATMDSVRGTEREPLCPDVTLGSL